MIYVINEATGFGKDLPTSCCNSSSCKSTELEFLQKKFFIKIPSTKYSKTDWEWIVYQTAALKIEKKETSEYLWKQEGVDRLMPHNLIMLDNCLLALAKNVGVFVDLESLIQFLTLWYRMEKHHLSILAYLHSTLFSSIDIALSKFE